MTAGISIRMQTSLDTVRCCSGKTSTGYGRRPTARSAAGSSRWRTSRPRPRARSGGGRCRSSERRERSPAPAATPAPGTPKWIVALMGDVRDHLGERQPHRERRQQEDKSRQRPGDPDIEQDPLGVDRRPDADERAEGPQKRRRHEVRQTGVHAMVQRSQVMSELMRQEDRQQRQRKRQALQQNGRDAATSRRRRESCSPGRTDDCGRNRPAWPRPSPSWSTASARTAGNTANSARAGPSGIG